MRSNVHNAASLMQTRLPTNDMAARGPDTDVVTSDPNGPILSLESVRLNVANLKNQALQRVLVSAIDAAQGDINQAEANIESWYNSGMDRVSGGTNVQLNGLFST
jgi:hypothetical protein